ncbi:DUF1848 family protein [candidate division KSB1 bacterium]|nr:DUF1848 family protein [candidate division KSB1 bacterium]
MRKVISASRRIDLVGGFPDQLAHLLDDKCPPNRVHTLVLWTKNAANLLNHQRLRETVKRYDQIYLHYSITGMGGGFLEPRIPPTEEALGHLPRLIRLVDCPQRIRIRFDPIVHLRLPGGGNFSNFPHFERVVSRVVELGITTFSISWMATYRGVVRRLRERGILPEVVSLSRRKEEAEKLIEIANNLGITINWCCVSGFQSSRCIDGELFNALHPLGYQCSTAKAKGQRELCGCTESWDIGWYNPCPHGCLYCYANPKIEK